MDLITRVFPYFSSFTRSSVYAGKGFYGFIYGTVVALLMGYQSYQWANDYIARSPLRHTRLNS